MQTAADDLVMAEGLIALGLAVERLRIGVCRELDLTPQQVQLLCALDHGSRSSGGLAALLGCDKTNITGLVDRLEPRGLVDRVRDHVDRRVVHIALTDDGRKVVGQFRQRASVVFSEGLGQWSVKRRLDLMRVTRDAVWALGPDLLDAAEGNGEGLR